MSEAIDKIKSFNIIVESLLSQTSEAIGTTTYYSQFKQLVKINAPLPINESIKYVLPHKEKIFNRDESYFADETKYLDEYNKMLAQPIFKEDSVLFREEYKKFLSEENFKNYIKNFVYHSGCSV